MKNGEKGSKKRIGHIVSHTHWDREWRYPVWETRLILVEFMDELIDLLEEDAYPGFLMDGQCTPVLDYLEIRPEQRERVEKLVSAGKLSIGPWLTLPDEYPVDGEALVRNLLIGTRKSNELGGAMMIAYTPFGWGQTAQLAQIYAGFGMDVALIGKRVNKDRAPKSEFIWRSPDGSELLATRFGEMGRQNFYFYVHLSALFGFDHFGPKWNYVWKEGRLAYHRADDEQYEQDHFWIDAPAKWYPEYLTRERLDQTWATTDDSVLENDRLMMNGCDYATGQPMFPEMLARINELDADTDREWVHETLADFVQVMRSKIDWSKLPVVHGELRDGPSNANTGNALTTRLYLKRWNKHAQNMLIRFAEPLSFAAAMFGAEYPVKFVQTAWENLLNSHPHDSINGVTQDKTVEDVMGRLSQVVDISQSLGNRAMQQLVKRIDMSEFADEDVLIVAFNPLPYPRREVAKAWVNIPLETPMLDVHMFDVDGKPIDTQWQGVTREQYCVAEMHTRAWPFNCQRHLLYFDTGEIPAGGYKIFRAGPGRGDLMGAQYGGFMTRTGTLLKAPNIIENAYLRVVMNPDGTFDLTDKERKRTYAGLNYYEDRGEFGSYWINQRPMLDQVHTSQSSTARIWVEETGPVQTTLVSEVTMRIPKRGDKELNRRGGEIEDFVIKTAVTLRSGARQVEVTVEFDNRCEDHFLRAMFPTGLKGATHADAGGHFIVDRRPIRPQGPTEDTVWIEMATLPQNNFVDLSDGKVGIAFLNDSLMEYEVVDSLDRVVALSLLRCVRNWVCTEGRCGSGWPSQKGGQCLGKHKIRYAIMPHAGNWEDANVPLEAEKFNIPLRLVQTRTHEGSLPAKQASLFAFDNPKLRFSAVKKTEDRTTFVVRFYNPTGEVQKGNLVLAGSVANAWYTDLNEKRLEKIGLRSAHKIPVTAEPQKIVTVEFRLKR